MNVFLEEKNNKLEKYQQFQEKRQLNCKSVINQKRIDKKRQKSNQETHSK